MILPFSTQLNGKPTYFVEKIWGGLEAHGLNMPGEHLEDYARLHFENNGYIPFQLYMGVPPKVHTLREDKANRWKPGMLIDFFINNRTPEMFRFAPRIPCVSTQKIEIFHYSKHIYGDRRPDVQVDDIRLDEGDLECLAFNDGFDSVEDFFAYFSKSWRGKIIHWTDIKY